MRRRHSFRPTAVSNIKRCARCGATKRIVAAPPHGRQQAKATELYSTDGIAFGPWFPCPAAREAGTRAIPDPEE